MRLEAGLADEDAHSFEGRPLQEASHAGNRKARPLLAYGADASFTILGTTAFSSELRGTRRERLLNECLRLVTRT